jgi:hypothetical protein
LRSISALFCGLRGTAYSEPNLAAMLGSFMVRALATVGKTVVHAAVNVAVAELRRPETQQKLADGAQVVANRSARVLGRAVGTWKNRD